MSDSFSNRISTPKRGVFLALIVLIFFISALVSLVQLRESIQILEARYGTSVWSMFQLRIEMRRFYDALDYYHEDEHDVERIQERYDLLWSRFPVLLEGLDGEHLHNVEQGTLILQNAFSELKKQEAEVFEQLASDPRSAQRVRDAISPHLAAIERLTLENYHLNNEAFNRGDAQIAALQQKLVILILGLIISGSLLLHMVVKENRRNRYQALHDSLTMMPNRAYLRRELTDLCNRRRPFAMHMIDLNGFKDVNDSLGHHTGDLLLKAVAARLVELVDHHHKSLTCRLGGDEFAVLQYGVATEDEMQPVIRQIIDALEDEFLVEGHACYIGASIGSVLYPEHGHDASTLLSRVDMAMYKAKEQGPTSSARLFQLEMDKWQQRRHQLNRDLREAIASGGLHIQYQPIVSLSDGSVRSLEALLRWNHPELGPISPLDIIDVAEQYGVANELGCWIIERVCQQYQQWLESDTDMPPVSINISPSMYRLDLVDTITQLIRKYGLSDGNIWIEVTEDTTMKVIKEAEIVLSELKEHGVSIALDDFGTGLSSLSHLQQLNLQALKIDRSFVKDIICCETSAALVKNIIAIGHDLGMRVVAEGIEDRDSAALLARYGCDYGQGYLFSRPLLPAQIPGFCRQYGLHQSVLLMRAG